MINEKDSESYALVLRFGDAVTDMFEQMIKGEWVDCNLHDVKLNAQMQALRPVMQAAINLRIKVEGHGA